MANIKLKDNSGNDIIYTGINKITVPKADGSGIVEFSEGGGNGFLEYYGDFTSTASGQYEVITFSQEQIENLMVMRANDMNALGYSWPYDGGFSDTSLLFVRLKNGQPTNDYVIYNFTWGDNGYFAGLCYYDKNGDYELYKTCELWINDCPDHITTPPPHITFYDDRSFALSRNYGGVSTSQYRVYIVKHEKNFTSILPC